MGLNCAGGLHVPFLSTSVQILAIWQNLNTLTKSFILQTNSVGLASLASKQGGIVKPGKSGRTL
jgi:hypothetical protein